LDGIVLVSRANQAAAFERIARAFFAKLVDLEAERTQLVAFFRRQPVRALARVQGRLLHPVPDRPRRGLELTGQFSGVRPLRTISTIRCRNSGAYGGWFFGIVDLPFRPNDGASTKPGQLQGCRLQPSGARARS